MMSARHTEIIDVLYSSSMDMYLAVIIKAWLLLLEEEKIIQKMVLS